MREVLVEILAKGILVAGGGVGFVVAGGDFEEILGLVGGVEEAAAVGEGNDAVGLAVDDQQGAVDVGQAPERVVLDPGEQAAGMSPNAKEPSGRKCV